MNRVVALAALLAFSVTAVARETPPPTGTPHPFALAAKEDLQLGNGAQITLVPFGTVPKTTILCVLDTGDVADGDRPGLADLVAAMLKEGAGSLDAAAVARLAAEMGGSLGTGAGPDQTNVSIDVLSERAADAIGLLADVLRRPRLPPASLPRLKADLARQVAIQHSQAQGIAGEAYAHLMWGDSVYGRPPPTDAQITAVTADDVRRFVAAEFSASRLHVYVSGRFDRARIEAALRRGFADWPAGARAARPLAVGSRARIVRLIDRPGAAQSTILLGLPVPPPATPGFMRLSVANALFGGSLLSRLDQNLREDKGYTYGASSSITAHRGVASWTVATDVNAPQTAAAVAEIFRELARLRSEPPPAEELKRIQNYRAGNFVLGASSRSGLLSQLAFLDEQHLPPDWLTHYVEHVNAVTPAEVRAAAEELLDPQAMTMVVVGDLAKIKTDLLALEALRGAEFR